MSANRFTWFPAETTQKLTAQLTAAGPDARLEVRQQGTAMTLQVVMPGDATVGRAPVRFEPLNDSRICPPICPG